MATMDVLTLNDMRRLGELMQSYLAKPVRQGVNKFLYYIHRLKIVRDMFSMSFTGRLEK